ncbi:uroporphyrinogen-III synthase [Komagataeibacter saccharivorans]|uniref:uroporphyrinogen-III synthase n=1 Tax=Komagataeibacter saccharivorans TaxID=265959 RepID=UPI0021ACF9DA|nr:uroporphyrinogen-III synthase [Komagataeibacter saccharivorans]
MPNRGVPPFRAASRNGVIITRPPPGLAPTMAAVTRLGLHPVAAPMLRIEQHALTADGPRPDGLVLTSGQAIAAVNHPQWHDVPCYVVGQATGARMRSVGFNHVMTAAGTADALSSLIHTAAPQGARLLLAVGRGYGREMATDLRGAGFRVVRRCVYAVHPERRLPAPVRAALLAGQVRSVMFYSTRTAQAFVTALDAALRPMLAEVQAIAMSTNVAAALETGPRWRAVTVAARPDQDAMLAALGAD